MVSCVLGPGSVDARLASTLLAVSLLASTATTGTAGADADPENPENWSAAVAEAPPPPEDAPPPWGPSPGGVFPFLPFGDSPQLLAPGVAPEEGLQVKTILLARSISAAFPQVGSMIGAHPDARPWHPNGLAVDVVIPNPGSPEGVALGDQIVAYALRNADRFALQDAIWRGTYHTPGGPAGGGYGHYEHVHITTFGGGYPTGDEQYLRADEDTAGR